MMWGKHYASTYEGSMVGSGAAVFAVWGYVISKMQPDKDVGAQVELNPVLLAFVIGESEGVIEKAIGRLCAPDKNSRSTGMQGRRLVKIGQFAYQVVNGAKYLGLKNLDEKRAADRERKRKQRASGGGQSMREQLAVKAHGDGDEELEARLAEPIGNGAGVPVVVEATVTTEPGGGGAQAIPEIPNRRQDENAPAPEPESGHMEDGEWVAD